MNRATRVCVSVAGLCWLSGCVALQEPVVYTYGLQASSGGAEGRRAIRVAVQRVEGRAQYHRPRMIVSPREQVIDSYTTSQWVDDPCDMLTDGLVSYLATRCEYVTLHPRVYKDAVEYVVTAYVDAFDHVRRGGRWYAVARIKFDIVDDATRTVLHSEWFERVRSLEDGQVATYVAGQQETVDEWYARVLEALERVSGMRGAGGEAEG